MNDVALKTEFDNELGLAIRDNIADLEAVCLKEEQAECPVYHHFSPGIYMREVHIPAGTFAIGHYQKTRHLNIFLKGSVSYVHDDGRVELLTAPMSFTSDPGRKVGFVHEDMVWLNVYPTTETDVETLEATYLDKSAEWTGAQKAGLERLADRQDFDDVLSEYGFDRVTVRMQSEFEGDQIPFPSGAYAVAVLDSLIEGKGLFATADFEAGDHIAPASIGGMRTPAGRYINHSKTPNATFVVLGDAINAVAITDIKGMRGGAKGEEITVNYRDALALKGVKKCQE